MPARQFVPGGTYVVQQALREWRAEYPFADRFAGRCQCIDIVDVEAIERVIDTFVETIRAEKIAIGCGAGRKAAGDSDSQVAKIADHFAERGVLATNHFDVIHAKLIELDDVSFQCLLP